MPEHLQFLLHPFVITLIVLAAACCVGAGLGPTYEEDL